MASEADKVGEKHAISTCQIVPKDAFRNAEVVESERKPTVIAFPHTCDNAGNYALYVPSEPPVGTFVPGSQMMPNLDSMEHFTPVFMDHVDEYEANSVGIESFTGGIEADGESTDFD